MERFQRFIAGFCILIIIAECFLSNISVSASNVQFKRITYQNAYLLYDTNSNWESLWDESVVFADYDDEGISITDLHDKGYYVSNDVLKREALSNISYCLDINSKNPAYTGKVYETNLGFEDLEGIYSEEQIDRIRKVLKAGYPCNTNYWESQGVGDHFVMMVATQIALWAVTSGKGSLHYDRCVSTINNEGTIFRFNADTYFSSPKGQEMLVGLLRLAIYGEEISGVYDPFLNVTAHGILPVYNDGMYEFGFHIEGRNLKEGMRFALLGEGDEVVVSEGLSRNGDYYLTKDSSCDIDVLVRSFDHNKTIGIRAEALKLDSENFEFFDIEDTYEGFSVQKMLAMNYALKLTDEIYSEASISGRDIVRYGGVKIFKHGMMLTGFSDGFVYEDTPLFGVTFALYADEDLKIKLDENVTDSEGYASFSDLPFGTYYLVEEVPSGYMPCDPIKVVIDSEGNEPVIEAISLDVNNERRKLTLQISKSGADGKLSGAYYGLYSSDDIKNYADEVILEKDSLIEMMVTDEFGNAYVRSDLPYGYSYYVKELKPPYGYAIDDRAYPLEDGSKLMLNDVKQKGSVSVKKTGEVLVSYENGFLYEERALSGVGFGLYRDETCNDLIEYRYTEDGIALFDDLDIGTYYVKEGDNPGFLKDDKVYVADVIPRQYESVIETTLVGIKNERIRCDITLLKTEKDGSAVHGATYELVLGEDVYSYDGNLIVKSGEVIERGITDSEGQIRFVSDLPYGCRFFIRETEAPAGYLVNTTEEYFVLDDEVIIKTYEDYTKVRFRKVDSVSGDEIKGAKLSLVDMAGHEIISFVSGEDDELFRVPSGYYYLIENSAPWGYEKITPYIVDIKAVGEFQEFEVVDEAIIGSLEYVSGYDNKSLEYVLDTPKTGDGSKEDMFVMLLVISLGFIVLLGRGLVKKKTFFGLIIAFLCIMSLPCYALEREEFSESDDNDFPETMEIRHSTYVLDSVEEIPYVVKGRSLTTNYVAVLREVMDLDDEKLNRELSVYDDHYKKDVYKSCEPSNIVKLEEYWIDGDIIDFTAKIKGLYLEFGDHIIRYDEETTGLMPYADEIMDDLNLDKESFVIDEIVWEDEAYEEDGEFLRKAVAKGRRRVSDYRLEYFVEIPLDDINEVRYRARYVPKKDEVVSTTVKDSEAKSEEVSAEETFAEEDSHNGAEFPWVKVIICIFSAVLLIVLIFLIWYNYIKINS